MISTKMGARHVPPPLVASVSSSIDAVTPAIANKQEAGGAGSDWPGFTR